MLWVHFILPCTVLLLQQVKFPQCGTIMALSYLILSYLTANSGESIVFVHTV